MPTVTSSLTFYYRKYLLDGILLLALTIQTLILDRKSGISNYYSADDVLTNTRNDAKNRYDEEH